MEPWDIMVAKIKMCPYVAFIKTQKSDTAGIMCFTVLVLL